MDYHLKSLKIYPSWLDYGLLGSCLVMIWGAVIYFLYALNLTGVILTLILSLFSFFLIKKTFVRPFQADEDSDNNSTRFINFLNIALILAFFIAIGFAFSRYFQAMSDKAIISPWSVINYDFFWLYALSALLLTLILTRVSIKSSLKFTFISLFYFLSFSAAAIIYRIGYGFDPFIHQAAMEIIAAKGIILPKTPYYLGEYSFIIILSKISGLAISLLNEYLMPFLAALFLPTALYDFLRLKTKSSRAIWLTILFLLALTFSPFILTTPQNLSYLFLLLAVLAAAGSANPVRVTILALTSAAIHPLSGLPALALAALAILEKYRDKFSLQKLTIIKRVIWLFTALSIPLALLSSAGMSFKNLGELKLLLTSFTNLLGSPSVAGQIGLVANFVYLVAYNYQIIIIALILSAFFIFKNVKNDFKLLVSALVVAYLLSGQIIFNSLINYEQSGYTDRIPVAILIFMIPAIALMIKNLTAKVLEKNLFVKISWLAIGLILLTVALYISYPRFDKYFNSRGYSTSANDLAAVTSINTEARGPYIVLANQQVSVAALKTFGFDHYLKTADGELYFYPIPTGSPLYQSYLDMVYKNPDAAYMAVAMNKAGVNTGYLVINKYWYQSGKIISEAKLKADKWWTINNEVYIFKYGR